MRKNNKKELESFWALNTVVRIAAVVSEKQS